ncbi:hypothetical protein LOD99_2295 [Oopsacas minuta]|uniref:Uncharacterized protein n=1 Tax=Oopsacas minuta TaxID=111878 RepID=A0AAV7K286_9METZ|nr:hypothetical protein LOD99_2295 [Oopsacas minuta]
MKNLINLSLPILAFILYFGFAPTSEAKTLSYKNSTRTVVLLKMSAKFEINDNGKRKGLTLEDQDLDVTGNISQSKNNNVSYEIITFIVSWNGTNYQFILTFNSSKESWTWENSTFVVKETILPLKKMISSFGDGIITTKANHSYVCMSPLDYTTKSVKGITVSVTWRQLQVEVYPRNNTKFDEAPKPCTVDVDDKIVPIAVGGALGLLLLLVVIIYVISYIRDRRQQSKELRSGYNRIDQPEPNHHS